MFDRILLAVDGSDHAFHAAHKAAELARVMKPVEFRIVVAYDTIPMYLGEPNLQSLHTGNFQCEAKRLSYRTIVVVLDPHHGDREGRPACLG